MRSFIVRSLFASAVVVTSLAAPAYAQDKPKNIYQIEAEERAKEAKRIDQEYKAALERERRSGAGAAQPAAVDPWSNMRGSEDSRTKR